MKFFIEKDFVIIAVIMVLAIVMGHLIDQPLVGDFSPFIACGAALAVPIYRMLYKFKGK
jgi:hypothetical protein